MTSSLNYRKGYYYVHRRNKDKPDFYDTEMVGWAKFQWILLREKEKFLLKGLNKNILIEK